MLVWGLPPSHDPAPPNSGQHGTAPRTASSCPTSNGSPPVPSTAAKNTSSSTTASGPRTTPSGTTTSPATSGTANATGSKPTNPQPPASSTKASKATQPKPATSSPTKHHISRDQHLTQKHIAEKQSSRNKKNGRLKTSKENPSQTKIPGWQYIFQRGEYLNSWINQAIFITRRMQWFSQSTKSFPTQNTYEKQITKITNLSFLKLEIQRKAYTWFATITTNGNYGFTASQILRMWQNKKNITIYS